MNQILTKLLSTKAHIGTKNWNKASAPFLLGFRKSPRIDKYAIFNLEKTIIALNQVLHFLKKLNYSSKSTAIHILIINTESGSASVKSGSLQLDLSKISTICGELSKKSQIIYDYAQYKSDESHVKLGKWNENKKCIDFEEENESSDEEDEDEYDE